MTTKEIACPTCGAEAGKTCRSVRSGKPLPDTHKDRRLFSIRQAAEMGIDRIRKPIWANQFDHMKIDIIGGRPGPWLHLFAPFNQECNGRDPVDLLVVSPMVGSLDEPEFTTYAGPFPDSEEYRAEARRFAGCLA